jgi:threonine dehydratase
MSMTDSPVQAVDAAQVTAAAARIAGTVRPVVLTAEDAGALGDARVTWACEYMQHSGTFKARGAANLAAYHVQRGTMPPAGIVIASGGNAGLACAWASRATGTPATVFVPRTAPAFKVERLRGYGARVELVGEQYAHALAASQEHARSTGALLSHAYDNPLIAAGAGTLALEILAQRPATQTLVVAVGGGGLFSGVAAAVAQRGVRVVAVEPETCRALNAALAAGGPVDVPVSGVAADSLGAHRVSRDAYTLACGALVESVTVPDSEIVAARRALWERRRIVVEHGAATVYAALACGAYTPQPDEQAVLVLCGANTDPADLVDR